MKPGNHQTDFGFEKVPIPAKYNALEDEMER